MILRNISLKQYNSFGLEYTADSLISLRSEEDAISVIKNREALSDPMFVIGGGSNLLFTKFFNGTLLHPEMNKIHTEEENPDTVIISAEAGVIWDNFVEWTVNKGFSGLENLSLIPGTVGATPVQNIGAYGVEVKDNIEKVRAISLLDGSVREFSNKECSFAYRDSIFKNSLKGKFLVTKVFFRVATHPQFKTDYGSLNEEISKLGPLSLKTIRQAVIKIRKSKLPDPVLIGNAGSFFKNPVISSENTNELLNEYPQMPHYKEQSGGFKIAAGWLIEQCGWKGQRVGDAGTYEKQALVIVNHGKATGEDIVRFAESVEKSVSEKFGINLQREVEVL